MSAYQSGGAGKLAETFLGNKEEAVKAMGEQNYNTLLTNLGAKGGSEEILKLIQDTLLKNNDINENGYKQLSENEIETNLLIGEANFKELAQALGGLVSHN